MNGEILAYVVFDHPQILGTSLRDDTRNSPAFWAYPDLFLREAHGHPLLVTEREREREKERETVPGLFTETPLLCLSLRGGLTLIAPTPNSVSVLFDFSKRK